MTTDDLPFLRTQLVAEDSFQDSVGESDAFIKAAAHIPALVLPPPERRAGHVIAGRYRLLARLGQGGNGEVWRALDGLSGAPVAIKLLRHGTAEAAARACREVASLRLLRLPGVVRLIDEGVEDGHPFMVMEHVQGVPFPGVPVPCPWSALKEPLTRLLDVLGRVHAAGLVHRDLKPENVLVDRAGNPVVLDFGIALVSSTFGRITEPGTVIGTPAYLAPEQILDDTLTFQTDLYAVGVMAFFALTGRYPHDASTFAALMYQRLNTAAPPVKSLAAGLPDHVALVVDWLLAPHAVDRPLSAAEAASFLRNGPSDPSSEPASIEDTDPGWSDLGESVRLDEEAVRAWFSGPDRLLHLREDAARILVERTGGIPDRVRREIEAWLAAGLACRDGKKLRVDRASLEQLRIGGASALGSDDLHTKQILEAHRRAALALAGGAPGRLHHLLAQGDRVTTAEIVAESLASAARLAGEGALGGATAHLTEGLFAARRSEGASPEALPSLLVSMVAVAFADGGPHALDRVLYELCRPGPTSPLALQLRQLVRAALAVDAWTERAAQLAEVVRPFDDVLLDRLRHGVRVKAARRVSLAREEEVLSEVGRWAESSGDALARASHAHWLGRLRYYQNRFQEAGRLQDEAAALSDWPPLRIAARFEGGAAWMEAFDLDAAAQRAEQARSLAEVCRHAFSELHAQCLARMIRYRAGKTDGESPDMELVEIAPLFGSAYWEGAVAVTEAAVAYRRGDAPIVRDLAGRALRAYAGAGHPSGTVLSRSLFVHAGGLLPEEETSTLAGRALACDMPTVGLQCLALLADAGVRLEVTDIQIQEMAATVEPEHRDHRLDVLSLSEALHMLARRP